MGSHHHHHHHHDHHGHDHSQKLSRVRWAFLLNLGFAIFELVGGFWFNSFAVLSDAIHDFGDALALGLAYGLEKSSQAPADGRFTYGYQRLSVLSALFTGTILLVGSFWIFQKSALAISQPHEPHSLGMMGMALVGLIVNGFAAWKISKGSSLSEKMIHWHLLEDVAGWAVVLVGAVVIHFFGWTMVDPLLGMGLSLWVVINVFRNLKSTFKVFLQATPENTDLETIKNQVLSYPEVSNVHHTHLWSMDGQSHILTTHILVKKGVSITQAENLKMQVKKDLLKHGISEATIELEWSEEFCLDPHHH